MMEWIRGGTLLSLCVGTVGSLAACSWGPQEGTSQQPNLAELAPEDQAVLELCAKEKKAFRGLRESVESVGGRYMDRTMRSGSERCEIYHLPDAKTARDLDAAWEGKTRLLHSESPEEGEGAKPPTGEHVVYDDFDTPDNGNDTLKDDGLRAQIEGLAAQHPELFTLHTIGESHYGRPIYVLEAGLPEGEGADHKSDVLFVGGHHAREWVAAELPMRYAHWLAENKDTPELRAQLENTRIWVLPMLNPDGYQYTFDGDRFWRKNLRDNNNNGVIDDEDGVDLNRNWPYKWGFDDNGSSDSITSDVYRGPFAGSEPETQALMALMRRVRFNYSISYHSYGNLILYPSGYRGFDPTADQPVFEYLAGTPENSAIWDSGKNTPYIPSLGADLYVTNGEFTDWAYHRAQSLSFTVELTDGEGGFVFPDEEEKLEQLFQDNLPFMNDLVLSSVELEKPVSHIRKLPLAPVVHKSVTRSFGSRQTLELSTFTGRAGSLVAERLDVAGEASEKRRLFRTELGLVYETQQAILHGVAPGETWGYHFEFESDPESDVARYPQDGKLVMRAAATAARELLLVTPVGDTPRSRADLEVIESSLLELGLNEKADRLTATPGEVLRYLDVLSHFQGVIWVGNSDNAENLNAEQLQELARYLRDGGKLWLTGSESLSASLDANSSSVTNFLLEAFGIANVQGPVALLSRADGVRFINSAGETATPKEGAKGSSLGWQLSLESDRGITPLLEVESRPAAELSTRERQLSTLHFDGVFDSSEGAAWSGTLSLHHSRFWQWSSAFFGYALDLQTGERHYLMPAGQSRVAEGSDFEDSGFCEWLGDGDAEKARLLEIFTDRENCRWNSAEASAGAAPVLVGINWRTWSADFDTSSLVAWLGEGETAREQVQFVVGFVDGDNTPVDPAFPGSQYLPAFGELKGGATGSLSPSLASGAFDGEPGLRRSTAAVANRQTAFTSFALGALNGAGRLVSGLLAELFPEHVPADTPARPGLVRFGHGEASR